MSSSSDVSAGYYLFCAVVCRPASADLSFPYVYSRSFSSWFDVVSRSSPVNVLYVEDPALPT